jgi:hypothetical protein
MEVASGEGEEVHTVGEAQHDPERTVCCAHDCTVALKKFKNDTLKLTMT